MVFKNTTFPCSLFIYFIHLLNLLKVEVGIKLQQPNSKILMILGVKFRAYPTEEQKLILSQWMGCARFIWNAKCDEDKYYRTFAQKFTIIKQYYLTQDQSYSHFKSKDLSPWLSDCPSQILRNTSTNWFNTLSNFKKGLCGRPKRKAKTDKGSIYLTRELFRFEKDQFGQTILFIGAKKK